MITLTPDAVKAFKSKLLAKHPSPAMIRLGVKGGGCVGLSYVIDFCDTTKDNDVIYNIDDLKVVIDNKSFKYLSEITLHHEKDLLGERFVWHNPKAKSFCSCGSSFSI